MENTNQPESLTERDLVREAANITFSRIRSYEELNAVTLEEGDRKFIEKTRELWNDFAVHGILGWDKETKKIVLLPQTDTDGRCALGLFKMAGMNTDNIVYLPPGQTAPGRINIDTGDKEGVVTNYDVHDAEREMETTAWLDHHAEESGPGQSATKRTYEALTGLGLLKREKYLDNLVNFVTQMDNRTFPDEEKYYQDSWHTMLGLYRFMDFDKLLLYFKSGRRVTDILSPGHLVLLGVQERSEKQKELVEKSLELLPIMEKRGYIIKSPYYGRIAIDVGNNLPGGFIVAKAYGCDSYLVWGQRTNSFFFSSTHPIKHELPQGQKVRDKMWVKRRGSERLIVTLGGVLKILTDDEFTPTGRLKRYLDRQQENKKLKKEV